MVFHPLRHAEGQRQVLPALFRNAGPSGRFSPSASGFALLTGSARNLQGYGRPHLFDKEMPDVIAHNLNTTEVGFLPYIAGDRQSLEPKRGAFTGADAGNPQGFSGGNFPRHPSADSGRPLRLPRNSLTLNKTISSPAAWWTTPFRRLSTSSSLAMNSPSSRTARCSATLCWRWRAKRAK